MATMDRTHARGILLLGLLGGCYSPNTPVGGGGGEDEDTSGGASTSATVDPTMTASSMSATTGDPSTTSTPTSSSTDVTDTDTDADTTAGGPFCGDGNVERDEVCDDGVNDSSYGSCTANCGAFGPRCGDDVIQGEEVCDDGNDVDGDGCNTDCVESGTLLWTVVFNDGVADGSATGVAAPSPDDIYVVGGGQSNWARRLDADGEEVWQVFYPYGRPQGVAVDEGGAIYVAGGTGHVVYEGDGTVSYQQETPYEGVWDVAVTADGNAVVVGSVDLYGAWARRYGLDGALLWTELEPDEGFDVAWGVAVDSEENVIVAGQAGVVPTLLDGWLKKYDANGADQWTYTYNSIIGNSSADNFQAVAIGPTDEIVCVGGSGNENSMDVWIGSFTADGDLSWTDTYSPPDGPTYASDVAVDGAGNVVVVASVPTVEGTRVWVRKYAAAGVISWTLEFNADDADAASTTVEGVAVDSSGGILVVGAVSTGAATDAWVGKISA
jgi:cysteine-rich repeat protein